jgi:acetyl-CoA carboxylase carboxyl transferase subunit alpha
MKITFDFEKPLADLQQQIEKIKQLEDKNSMDMSATIAELEDKLKSTQH